MADARHVLAGVRPHGAALGRRLRGLGRAQGARSARAAVADPTADPTAYTRRLSLLDPGYRAEALREIRRIVPTVRGRAVRRTTTRAATSRWRPCPRGAAGAPVRPRARAATSAGRAAWPCPTPRRAPRRAVAEGLRWLAWTRFSGDRFFAMKEGQARPHQAARPRRPREPQRLRLHRRLHPVGLHAPVAVRRRRRGRPLRELPGAGPGRPGALQPRLRRQADVRPDRQARAHRRAGVRLLALPAHAGRPLDVERPGPARRGHRPQLLRLRQPALHEPPPLRRDALHRPRRTGHPSARAAIRPRQLVLYATASEGQAQPGAHGRRALPHSGDALYTTYSLLGELAGRGLQLRRRHPPRRRALAPARRRGRSGCRAATRSTPPSPSRLARVGAGGRARSSSPTRTRSPARPRARRSTAVRDAAGGGAARAGAPRLGARGAPGRAGRRRSRTTC